MLQFNNVSKADGMNLLNCSFAGTAGGLSFEPASAVTTNALHIGGPSTAWGYWQDFYYPQIIRESYPVYIKERAEDKGKQAFEIIKALQDKKLMKLDKVSDFIEAMDILIKTL